MFKGKFGFFISILLFSLTVAPTILADPVVQWQDNPGDFSLNAYDGFPNVEMTFASFLVISEENSYDIAVSIAPGAGWNNVQMDTTNISNSSNDHAKAFDIAVTDQNGVWQMFKTGGTNVTHLTNQRTTDTLGQQHQMAIALVLVDKDGVDVEGIPLSTSGQAGNRRFIELPTNNYQTNIKITVTEKIE